MDPSPGRWRTACAGGLAGLVVTALLVPAAFLRTGTPRSAAVGSKAKPPAVAVAQPRRESAPYLKGRLLRREFALRVEVLGSKRAPGEDVEVLHEGDFVSFRVRAARDCHVGVWDVTARKVIQLFPNEYESDNRFDAGEARDVLTAQSRVRASRSAGTEFLHVIASTRPLRPTDAPALRAGPFAVYADGDFRGALRGLELVPEEALVSEVVIPFEVRPRPPADKNHPGGG
jgi:hypothetical protein